MVLFASKIISTAMGSMQFSSEKSKFVTSIISNTYLNEKVNEDAEHLNIQESLDLTFNKEAIANISGPGGGKSGEFFLFSKDRKLILKTIPDVEMNEVGKMLEKYEQHFKENPDSLIAKLYGAYTFASTEVGEKFNLIIMKNINPFTVAYPISGMYCKKKNLIQHFWSRKKIFSCQYFLI